MFQISDDEKNFKTIKEFGGGSPSVFFGFDEQIERYYRFKFNSATKEETPLDKITLSEIEVLVPG
jgi:hypothetical protein